MSGGFSSGYSCAFDKARGSRKAVYSLQFLANTGTEDKLLKRLSFLNLTVLDSAIVSERQHFYYLGEYLEEKTAWRALTLAEEALGSDVDLYRPVLVSYTREYENVLPRIRLLEPAVLSGSLGAAKERSDRAESSNSKALPKISQQKTSRSMSDTDHRVNRHKTSVDGPFYTIQLAAFKSSAAQVAFANNHSNFKIYCRKKSNGLYANYVGVFTSYAKARDYRLTLYEFDYMKPYILKFNDVSMSECETSKE